MKQITVYYSGKPIYETKEAWAGSTALLIAMIFQRIDSTGFDIEDAGLLHIEIIDK
jgi:hypothetical protein